MKKVLLVLTSLLIAYLTWALYNSAESWKFFVAFIGGGIDAFLLTYLSLKK